MEALVDASWRIYPSIALIALGMVVWYFGTRMAFRGLGRPMSDLTRMQAFVQGFRIAVIGITVVGLGISWNWHVVWLFVLSLVFGGEEIMESTTHLAILRWKPRPIASKPSI